MNTYPNRDLIGYGQAPPHPGWPEGARVAVNFVLNYEEGAEYCVLNGMVYLTRQIAADYADRFIICNAVAPGKIITGKGGTAMDPGALAYSKSRTPMPRLGKPNDVAAAALFLASDECTYTTGVNLMVDGGWMAS